MGTGGVEVLGEKGEVGPGGWKLVVVCGCVCGIICGIGDEETYSIRKNIHASEIGLCGFCRNGPSVCGFGKGLGR